MATLPGNLFASISQLHCKVPQMEASVFRCGSYSSRVQLQSIHWIFSFHASLLRARMLLIAWHRSGYIRFCQTGLIKPAVPWPWTSPVQAISSIAAAIMSLIIYLFLSSSNILHRTATSRYRRCCDVAVRCNMVDEDKNKWIIRLMLAAAMEDIPWTGKVHGHGTAGLIRPVWQNRM